MAKISLLKGLTALLTLRLSFVGKPTLAKDKDGKMIATFTLLDPIPHVAASQTIDVDGVNHKIDQYDVQFVKVHEDDMAFAEEDFIMDDQTNDITFESDKLILDVAKSNREVWLRQQTFATTGRAYGNDIRRERRIASLGLGTAPVTANAGAAGNPTANVNAQVGA